MYFGIFIYFITTTVITLIITVYVWILASKFKKKVSLKTPLELKAVEIIQLIKDSKPFPVEVTKTWLFVGCKHSSRVWKRTLKLETDNRELSQDVYGCFTKVRAGTQSVLNTLRDIEKLAEWDCRVEDVNYISLAPELPTGSRNKQAAGHPVQTDLIATNKAQHFPRNWDIKLWQEYMKRVVYRHKYKSEMDEVTRYWHRQDNGCSWYLQFNILKREWWYFLAQPLEEMDECKLTILYHPGCFSARWPFSKEYHVEQVAEKISCLKDYFENRKLKCVPLINITVPGTDSKTESECDSDRSIKVKHFGESISAALKKRWKSIDKDVDGSKSESPNFISKVKSMIEENKNKRKNLKPNGENLKDLEKPVVIEESSENEKCLDDSGSSYDMIKEHEALDIITGPDKMRSPLPRLHNVSGLNGAGDAGMPSSRIPLLHERSKSLGAEAAASSISHPRLQKRLPHVGNGDIDFKTLANQTAAEVLAEILKSSNIDTSRPFDEQAEVTGGWVFCGVDRDVVILRKMYEDDNPLQTYLGKGLVKFPPELVWESLKNACTRFMYDEMLKKCEVLHDFGNGMKIVYLYHEVAQLFRKEARDFYVLQSERQEGKSYVLGMHSVHWPGYKDDADVPTGLFYASGWLIEPAVSIERNKLYSMVTYFVQMDLGDRASNGYIVDEIAAKQPTSIALLRQYLTETDMALHYGDNMGQGL